MVRTEIKGFFDLFPKDNNRKRKPQLDFRFLFYSLKSGSVGYPNFYHVQAVGSPLVLSVVA